MVNKLELADTIGISNDTITKYLYILEKSFIIKLIKPFYKNIRKELTKMPKVFFLDNGYRNALLNNFAPIQDRMDRGIILENTLFIEIVKSGVERINYWRTQKKEEIDFVINEQYAFEVKMQKERFRQSKYSTFTDTYHTIPLYPVSFNDPASPDILDFTS